MAFKVHVSRKALIVRFFLSPWGKVLVVLCAIGLTLGISIFTYYYVKYSRLIEAKLAAGPFAQTSMLFASPRPLMLGEETTPSDVSAQLRRSGYTESHSNRIGYYELGPDSIQIYPGPDSYFDREAAVIKFSGGRTTQVSQIISLRDNTERTQYMLEPELITALFDRKREKRRLVKFADIPDVMRNAVISAEDKRFYQHNGFDPIGIIRAVWVDVKEGRHDQGASTLSMQLARSLWLTTERTWHRKIPEALITLHLEQKLSKEQIFEYYSNEIYLGHRGSFSIHGFGEAAQIYFGKDLKQLTLPEAALLAGLIQSPAGYDPFRHPDKAKTRRNTILKMMLDNGYINEQQYTDACTTPIKVSPEEVESSDAPYFVDLVNESLQQQFGDRDFQTQSYKVYTTLDMTLQRDAVQAVKLGAVEIDAQLKRRYKAAYGTTIPLAQIALIALDPVTGEIKAFVGGRSYAVSQLDRALAKRQPGSAFKPLVYTAAINTAVTQGSTVFTPVSTEVDEPTTFWFDNKSYEPNNFEDRYMNGPVTLRYAMAHSLNVPTVKLAEAVGYDKVVELARSAGLNLNIRATPAVALGAYEVTPIEIAGAYTMFANHGEWTRPNYIKTIRDQDGGSIFNANPDHKQVLDPRVAYIMVDMLEEVLRSGTGAGVRARGFTLPAAGKTGTSFDGWFAGFTSKLLCVVWVGFDDNRELKLEGARSALPVWTEFMKRAHSHREYRNVSPFEAPDGIVTAEIDPVTGQLASPACPKSQTEVFIAGTQPVEVCRLHGGGRPQIIGWEPTQQQPAVEPSNQPNRVASRPDASRNVQSIPVTPSPPPQQEPKQRKGFFSRIRDIFKK